jgi:hypothetical protein
MILDGLDESSHADRLLDLLIRHIPLFPFNIKLFICSRHEPNIAARIRRLRAFNEELHGGTVDEIKAVFDKNLGDIALERGLSNWPNPNQVWRLVLLSEGLFVWVSTVCKFIAGTKGNKPQALLELVLSQTSRMHAESALDGLYLTALKHITTTLR